MGLLNNVIPFSLIAWAQGHVPSGLAAILNATTPLFAVIVAHVLTGDERMTPGRARRRRHRLRRRRGDDRAGRARRRRPPTSSPSSRCSLASVFYAFSPIYGRRFGRAGLAPMVAATGQFTAATVMMVPLALVIDAPVDAADARPAGVGRAARARRQLDGPRLHHLLPHPRHRRRGQPDAGHVPRAGERRSSSARSSSTSASRRSTSSAWR